MHMCDVQTNIGLKQLKQTNDNKITWTIKYREKQTWNSSAGLQLF